MSELAGMNSFLIISYLPLHSNTKLPHAASFLPVIIFCTISYQLEIALYIPAFTIQIARFPRCSDLNGQVFSSAGF